MPSGGASAKFVWSTLFENLAAALFQPASSAPFMPTASISSVKRSHVQPLRMREARAPRLQLWPSSRLAAGHRPVNLLQSVRKLPKLAGETRVWTRDLRLGTVDKVRDNRKNSEDLVSFGIRPFSI